MFRLLALLFVMISLRSVAQDMVIYGRVREHERMAPIPGAVLGVSRGGVHHFDLRCDSTGFYRITVDVGSIWRISYAAPDRVTKIVEYDLRQTPRDDGGYRVNVDIRLFRNELGKDFSFLDEPIGIFRYDQATENMKIDQDYSAPRMARLAGLMPEAYKFQMPDTVSGPR